MRAKIIAVTAVIVLIVGLLSFAILRTSLLAVASNPDLLIANARRDADGAGAQLQLASAQVERWLLARTAEPTANEPFTKADPGARGDAATAYCDGLLSQAKSIPVFGGKIPALCVVGDSTGKIVGRNGSRLGRGEDLTVAYPALKAVLAEGTSGSDIWVNPARSDQFVVSYAPIRDGGKVVGFVVAGITINDALTRIAGDNSPARVVALAVHAKEGWQLVAQSTGGSSTLAEALKAKAEENGAAIAGGSSRAVISGDAIAAADALESFGDGKHAAVMIAAPSTLIDGASAMANPILAVTALGIVLAFVGGWLLGNYITQPIDMLEEGLLAILNGQDRRFELDHAELGGLAFRIDQLLNQLMGVAEDTTDDEGRPAMKASQEDFKDAMAVDRTSQPASAPEAEEAPDAARLAAEPEGAYYTRIYREYIAAKKALGEATDHITEEAFVGRIRSMEAEATQKLGHPVRYQVKPQPTEVSLLAVPLG